MGASAEHEAEGGWAVGPAFSLPIPLFNQGQPAIASARAELRRGGRSTTRWRCRSSRGRAGAERRIAAHDQAEHYRKVVLPLRNKIVEQTQLQYNAMQIGPSNSWLQSNGESIAGVAYVRACGRYWPASIWSSSAAGCPPVRLLSVQNHLYPGAGWRGGRSLNMNANGNAGREITVPQVNGRAEPPPVDGERGGHGGGCAAGEPRDGRGRRSGSRATRQKTWRPTSPRGRRRHSRPASRVRITRRSSSQTAGPSFKVVDGVKVFHLVAEEVYHEFARPPCPLLGVQRVRTRPGD